MLNLDCTTKVCTRCNTEKPLTEFSPRNDTKAGYHSHCKVCRNGHIREVYHDDLDESREYNKAKKKRLRLTSDKPLETQRKWQSRNREKLVAENIARQKAHPEQHKAHKKVLYAVKVGKLPAVTSLTCADCGKPARNYHHEDYSKPLDVIPLCRFCHAARHSKE